MPPDPNPEHNNTSEDPKTKQNNQSIETNEAELFSRCRLPSHQPQQHPPLASRSPSACAKYWDQATTGALQRSRSSSPKTPETSDVPHIVTIRGELPSWYGPLPIAKGASAITVWDGDPFRTTDDERMLQLDDIIQEHVYDDSACSGVENSPPNNHAPPELASLEPLRTSLRWSIHESGLSIPPLSQMHSISIVPPPAARTCKRGILHLSLASLAILTPNIPENGTKSRVETQVRVTVDLAHASTSAGEQNQYDRVGSWKWLKLPPGTSTKRRTRREGKIAAEVAGIESGNDRTTPRIVLDILGIDPKVDPEPLMFRSIGEGSRQISYDKVYSGLYEFEGHVVPYMVVVKVGRPTERSRPGNRGKRDGQILLMHYLNRVHFDAPMSPLELEIYHQMRNVIGIHPAFYEYISTVDADTVCTLVGVHGTAIIPESLDRLVALAADGSSIIGFCGETKLSNEEGSWWTMIQAFESLFGSVSCLPGCSSLYRVRTADKGRPIIISNRIIDEYAECNVDTLHKKNLVSLGEDRFLTTLLKHFPTFKTKFILDTVTHTMAPESWRVLFSQRRRWNDSTILPATVVYLGYLIVAVATGSSSLPLISIIMLGITYGLQALICIIKREFMLVSWMVVYLLSYPVYSFFLPIYSFWCMDDFSWGNARVVIGDGGSKKVVMNDDERFDESMTPLKKFSGGSLNTKQKHGRVSRITRLGGGTHDERSEL
ncbi:chitin synthase-domain-containing protein [Boletus edulis BED1]|uniref:chitin synthase n=1 Tax=Boletus edulis BED1 TaxID=1328754 RepID=A0AAD4G5S8_BOLED|nr:chitin synthase-domain-containing protein [Boletus edulis BED1]